MQQLHGLESRMIEVLFINPYQTRQQKTSSGR